MSEAPERISIAPCHTFKAPNDYYVVNPANMRGPMVTEYVRADLVPQWQPTEAEWQPIKDAPPDTPVEVGGWGRKASGEFYWMPAIQTRRITERTWWGGRRIILVDRWDQHTHFRHLPPPPTGETE